MRRLRVLITSFLVSLVVLSAAAEDLIFIDGLEGDSQPRIAGEDILGAVTGEDFGHQLKLAGGITPVATWNIVSGPAGLAIDGNGLLSWTPEREDTGDHPVVAEVVDIKDRSDTEAFVVTVILRNSPPLIGDIDNQGAVADTDFSLMVPASDPDVGDDLLFSLSTAPAGMGIDPATGLLSWTPSVGDIGDHPVTVSVSDRAGFTDNAIFQVSVYASNSPPQLTAIPDQGATPEVLFTLMPEAVDGEDDPLTFTLLEKPAGMSVNAQTGLISWTPLSSALGQAMVTIQVSDGRGGKDSKSFKIVVDQNRAPVAVDDFYQVQLGETLSVTIPGVLINDTDPNFDILTAVLDSDVTKGDLSLNLDGAFDYTPDVPSSPLGFNLKYGVPTPNGGPNSTPRIADVDNDGITDMVVRFSSGVANQNTMLVVRGDTGAVLYQSPPYDRSVRNNNGTDILADIDLDGRLEMISIGAEGGRSVGQDGLKLVALEHDGTFKWVSDPLPDQAIFEDEKVFQLSFASGEIAVADLDQDGTPEIIAGISHTGVGEGIGMVVFDNQGKHLFTRFARGDIGALSGRAQPEIVDLDLDGDLEVLILSAAFSHTGEVLWLRNDLENLESRSNPIAANLDDDPYPELVRSTDDDEITVLNHDGSTLWTQATVSSFETVAVPLVVADVDGDGRAEVIGANSSFSRGRLQVLNGADGTLKWQYPPLEEDGLFFRYVPPTVFDVDRDGEPEVLLLDQDRVLHLLNGADGTLIGIFDLLDEDNQPINITSMNSYAMFADIDQDGASELVLSGTFQFGLGASTLIWVYEAPNDDWAPTGSIWNQQNFHVTNINPDGTVPQFEQPHWLLPGLNQNRINGLLPSERVSEFDMFTYHADDGELDSNTATVSIEILPPNNPPQILSTPRTLASPGFEYFYPVLAVDPDVGEVLTFSLVEAPVGMSINLDGQITWTPANEDLGQQEVILQVTDSIGFTDTQIFTVEVRGSTIVPHVVGLSQPDAENAIAAADLTTNPIIEVFDNVAPAGQVVSQSPGNGTPAAAGDDVRIEVSKGPAPVPVPKVVGLDLVNAEDRLIDSELVLGTVTFVNRDDLPLSTVISQDPAPVTEVPSATAVDLTVSGGPRVDMSVAAPVITSGESTIFSITVFSNEGVPLDPQPPVNLSIEFEAGETMGSAPVISGGEIQTDATTQGEFKLRVDLPDTAETFFAPLVVMPPVSDDEEGGIFSEFSGQIERYDDLLEQLNQAILINDFAAIELLDEQLLILRDELSVDLIQGTSALVPEGGIPPDAETAIGMGAVPGAYDDAYVDLAESLAETLEQMTALVADPLTPNVILFNLNQEVIEQAEALKNLEPGLPGILDAAGPVTNILNYHVPSLLAADIDAIHQQLVNAGLATGSTPTKSGKPTPSFTLVGIMSGSTIRNKIIKNVYYPLLGDLIRASVILVVENFLLDYLNFGNLAGIISAASLTIHVADIPNSVIEGFGFEAYAPANTTLFIGPDKIEQAQKILSTKLPSAKDLKDVESIKKEVKKVAGIGDKTVALAQSAIKSPGYSRRDCLLSPSPLCSQLVFPNGFEAAYYNDGPLALPAPVLIVTFGLTTGNVGIFVGVFLPVEPPKKPN